MAGVIPDLCGGENIPAMMQKVVRVESGGNPYAIGVVGARLVRQPRTLAEAVATVRSLEANRFNYSIGISQVNRIHFVRLGWRDAIEKGFDICTNLRAGAGILKTCYDGAVKAGYPVLGTSGANHAERASLSCYYSGNYVTGEKLGYVAKVLGYPAPGDSGALARSGPAVLRDVAAGGYAAQARQQSSPSSAAGFADTKTFPSMFD
jgi:type IV secretion system protein VirB1